MSRVRTAVSVKMAGRPSKEAVERVLFTGGGGAGSEALSRLLGERYEVHFADADTEARPYPVPQDRWHQIPFASDPAFVEELQHLCCDLDVSLLVPGVDEELLPIAHVRETLSCEVLLPSTEFIRAHLDKLTSNLLLKRYGVPVPQTELLPERQRVSFPCIVKPRKGRGSRGVAVAHSDHDLHAHVMLCRRQPDDFIVQELLQGQEYTVMMAADRAGVLGAVVPVKVGLKKGITLRAETDHEARVIDACVAIHSAEPVAGCYNIQLVKTEAGAVKPFEINPRISTTACLALAAGIDFLDIYLVENHSRVSNQLGLLPFHDHLSLRRSWYNEFIE